MHPDLAEIVGDLTAQHAELEVILDRLDESGWQRPSRCEGWTVADVVIHLSQTDELAVVALGDGIETVVSPITHPHADAGSIDEMAGDAVQRERGRPPSETLGAWKAASDDLRRRLTTDDPHRRVTWVGGQLSVRTLVATRIAEAWIHTGDIAAAFGPPPAPADRLVHVARLAWRTLSYAFARAGRQLTGPVAFELRAPSGATWEFRPEEKPTTTIRGDGAELCLVAAQRVDPAATSLTGDGPDVDAVLDLVRTYA